MSNVVQNVFKKKKGLVSIKNVVFKKLLRVNFHFAKKLKMNFKLQQIQMKNFYIQQEVLKADLKFKTELIHSKENC